MGISRAQQAQRSGDHPGGRGHHRHLQGAMSPPARVGPNATGLVLAGSQPGAGGATAATTGYNTAPDKDAGNVTDRSAAFTTTITARVVKVRATATWSSRASGTSSSTTRSSGSTSPACSTPTPGHHQLHLLRQVAELKVGYGGQGVVDETLKPGYVSRLLPTSGPSGGARHAPPDPLSPSCPAVRRASAARDREGTIEAPAGDCHPPGGPGQHAAGLRPGGGLKGTGDTIQSKFTIQSLANLLARQGLRSPPPA